jgi:hypothetical protein
LPEWQHIIDDLLDLSVVEVEQTAVVPSYTQSSPQHGLYNRKYLIPEQKLLRARLPGRLGRRDARRSRSVAPPDQSIQFDG